MSWFKRERKQYFFYEHDIHSHILPGLDDGVKRIENSVVIMKKMLELGIKRFSFTPHISFPSPMNTPEIIHEKLSELKGYLLNEGIKIEADAGAEYKVGEYMLDLIQEERIASFDGGKVLVEHSFVAPSPSFEEVVFRLQNKGYVPVLAHPERYPFYAGRLAERVRELKRRGCRIQVNLLSFVGFYGNVALHGAKELATAKLIDHVSGDIHSVKQVELLEKFLKSKEAGVMSSLIVD